MKKNKYVHVTKYDIREYLNRNYLSYNTRFKNNEGACTREFGVQYNYKRDNVICTCKHISGFRKNQEVRLFGGVASPVYPGSSSFTDIGVGSIKYQRRRVRRIYVPDTEDRGVGSSDLSSYINRRTRYYRNYDNKRTSTKCVGETDCQVINEKLSPIVLTKSVCTSPFEPFDKHFKNIESANNCERTLVTMSTQVDNDLPKEENAKNIAAATVEVVEEVNKDNTETTEVLNVEREEKREKRMSKRALEAERVFSSDSLVQHVHNLENPSQDKPSQSVDPMENKLEKEYMKMFSINSNDKKSSEDKNYGNLKSNSNLRRRFEAFRRGLASKEDSKRKAVLAAKASSNISAVIHRDVSITSDPPSLEGRSYSNTKIQAFPRPIPERYVYINPIPTYERKEQSFIEEVDSSECHGQGVKGMFKLWGQKFNLEEEGSVPGPSVVKSKDELIPKPEIETESEVKKEGKKFFFFKKKSKEKAKQPFKQKKGVTTGRCEVGDGFMIKIGGANPPLVEKTIKKERGVLDKPQIQEEISRKPWLQKYVGHTIESRRSVKIRWNKMVYATSSSTISEIVRNVYKNAGVDIRSTSEVTTGDSSYYKSFTKQRVNFMQDIEAWMIPKLIPDKLEPAPIYYEKEIRNDLRLISDQNWIIDKSKTFAHAIEVVLHSKNTVTSNKASSEHLIIDIPKGFFSDFSNVSMEQSNEEIYKIVEYETLDTNIRSKDCGTGDGVLKEINSTVNSNDTKEHILETMPKLPNADSPNVIEVDIITQKDFRRCTKPILKNYNYTEDRDSDQDVEHYENNNKFADTYMRDFYRNYPFGIFDDEMFPWHVSDSHVKECSDNSQTSFNQDVSKSCPNIYDDYHTSTIVSSCGMSCCSKCRPYLEEPQLEPEPKGGMFSIIKRNIIKNVMNGKNNQIIEKRFNPKDSVEVSKKRKCVNEIGNKSKWFIDDKHSKSSTDSKCAWDTQGEGSNLCKTGHNRGVAKKKVCNKRVSMYDSKESRSEPDPIVDSTQCPPTGILSFKGSVKCDYCNKGKQDCPKHAKTIPKPTVEIPPPNMPCKTPIPACKRSKDSTLASPKPCRSPPRCQSPSPSCRSTEEVRVHCFSSSRTSPCAPCTKCGQPKPPCQQKKPLCIPNIAGKCRPTSPPKQTKSVSKTTSPISKPGLKLQCKSTSPLNSGKNSSKGSRTPSPSASSPSNCQKLMKSTSPPPAMRKRESPCRMSRPCNPPVQRSPPRSLSRPKKLATPSRPGFDTSTGCPPPPCPPITPPHPSCCPPDPCPPNPPPRSFSCSTSPQPELNEPAACPPQKILPKPSQSHKKCKTPPCSPPKPPRPPCTQCKKCPSLEFPWPLKNQLSNQPSKESLCPEIANNTPNINSKCKLEIADDPNNQSKCKSSCSLLPEHAKIKTKPCPRKCNSPPKTSGIFLKMLPSKKTCAKECSAWNDPVTGTDMADNFDITVRQDSASTEEIREGMHIKVQDEDGRTLFERIDYRKNKRPSVLNDMYRAHVNTVSTSKVPNMTEYQPECNATKKVANLIEINLKMNIKCDENTDLNNENERYIEKSKIDQKEQTSHQVFIVKDEGEQCAKVDKNDLNIKIVIKNYKPASNGNKAKKYNMDIANFTEKITNKLHTVSTGYSDILQFQTVGNKDNQNISDSKINHKVENIECYINSQTYEDNKRNGNEKYDTLIEDNAKNVYSINTVAVSSQSSKITRSNEALRTEYALKDPIYLPVMSPSATDKSDTEQSESKLKHKGHITKTDSHIDDIGDIYTCHNDNRITDTDKLVGNFNTNNKPITEGVITDIVPTSLTKDEKKLMLKRIFEKACKKMKGKDKMKQLKSMLQLILTSDSSDEGTTSNEVIKDGFRKRNHLRGSDSMNNYCNAVISSMNINENLLYPTQEHSQCSTDDSNSVTSDKNKKKGCVCSTLAARLNIFGNNAGTGCCCEKAIVDTDNGTCCDFVNENDLQLDYNSIDYVNVETQNSIFTCNSRNLSVHSRSIVRSIELAKPIAEIIDKNKNNTKCNSDSQNIITEKKYGVSRIDNLNTVFAGKTNVKPSDFEKFNNTSDISDNNDVYATKNSNRVKGRQFISKKGKFNSPSEVLQCYETKKAVLKIYAEKTLSNEKEFVAKLPKFVYYKESEIEKNYEELIESYRAMKRNVMSVNR